MSRTLLAVQGSPRKNGNTNSLLLHLLDGAMEAGATTMLVHLAGLTIRECDGCLACWRGKPCTKHDDLPPLLEQVAAADVVVFGTPVYWYGPTGLMKLFLDRFVYFNCPEHRPLVRGKSAALVVPFEEESAAAAGPLVSMFELSLRYLEMNLVDTLLVPGSGERQAVLGANFDLDCGLGDGHGCVHPSWRRPRTWILAPILAAGRRRRCEGCWGPPRSGGAWPSIRRR